MVLEDLNCYLDIKQKNKLKEHGVVMVSHNPFKHFYFHLFRWNMRRIFNRNHQKVMIVDDKVYAGSMNISQRYTTRKYGTRSFRDLSVISSQSPARYGAKDFFLNALQENKIFHEEFDLEKAEMVFGEIEQKWKQQDEASTFRLGEGDSVEFQREEPPKRDEISSSLL